MTEPSEEPTPQESVPQNGRTVIDAAADLLQVIVDWLRQEASVFVQEKVILPLQAVGLTLFAASAAASLLVIGMVFISVASMILLAEWITWPGALYLVGGVLVLGSLAFTYFKTRMMQK